MDMSLYVHSICYVTWGILRKIIRKYIQKLVEDQIVVNFRCNSEFNGRLRDKEKGEDRRCSFRLNEKKWIEIKKKEQETQENMSIALALEGEEVVGNMLHMERQQKEQEITENMSNAIQLEGEDAAGNDLGVGMHAVASATL